MPRPQLRIADRRVCRKNRHPRHVFAVILAELPQDHHVIFVVCLCHAAILLRSRCTVGAASLSALVAVNFTRTEAGFAETSTSSPVAGLRPMRFFVAFFRAGSMIQPASFVRLQSARLLSTTSLSAINMTRISDLVYPDSQASLSTSSVWVTIGSAISFSSLVVVGWKQT